MGNHRPRRGVGAATRVVIALIILTGAGTGVRLALDDQVKARAMRSGERGKCWMRGAPGARQQLKSASHPLDDESSAPVGFLVG